MTEEEISERITVEVSREFYDKLLKLVYKEVGGTLVRRASLSQIVKECLATGYEILCIVPPSIDPVEVALAGMKHIQFCAENKNCEK